MNHYKYLFHDLSEFVLPDSKNHLKISWDLYHAAMKEIIGSFNSTNFKPDYIYGLPRGGLVPAVELSHNFERPMIKDYLGDKIFKKVLKPFHHKFILIVDDISDTGTQLLKLTTQIKEIDNQIFLRTFTVVQNNLKTNFYPDYYCFKNIHGYWVDFPWEK